MDYKRPSSNDFEQMVTLQNKNLVSVLNSVEKADGFLSASFSAEQFKAMDDDLCVVICEDEGKICGYICVTSVEFNTKIPLVAAMCEQFPSISYHNRSLATYNHAISGPVCIDKEYRGREILFNLYRQIRFYLSQEHSNLELFTVLIAKENQRSINAHKKLGMEIVGQFAFNSIIYLVLVLPINSMEPS